MGGSLSLINYPGLTALPNWITTLGPTSQGEIREVHLESTGLSDRLIDRLRTAESPGMQFHFSRHAGQPEQRFQNWEQAFDFWRDLASFCAETPELPLRSDQAADLLRFLEQLTATADYHNQAVRPFLAKRVIYVMALLTGNEPARRLSENSARSEDGRKLRIEIPFCEVNSGSIYRTKRNFRPICCHRSRAVYSRTAS